MEWFKFRMCWSTPLQKLNDEEIGKVIRGLLVYLHTEEEQETGSRGDVLLWQMTETLKEDICRFRETAEKKRESARIAARKRWHLQDAYPDAEICDTHTDADAECKNKNKKQKKNKETDSETEKEEDTEAETEGEGGSSSVLPPAATELPVLTIPLINGTDFPVYRKDVDEYVFLYPDVNVEQELRNMKGWCQSNPTRRKTKRGVSAFINSWLKKSQQEAAMKYEPPENPFLKYATGEAEIGAFLL